MPEPKKTIVVNPDFLKFPSRVNRTKKNRQNGEPKPIKIRSEKKTNIDKTYKRRALNYIRKHQDEKYRRMMRGDDESDTTATPINGGNTYAAEFKSSFDESLDFLQKLTDQNAQKIQSSNLTLKQYPHIPNSAIFQEPILNQILDQNIGVDINDNKAFDLVTNNNAMNSLPIEPTATYPPIKLPAPTYGCLKGGKLPTYRTVKSRNELPSSERVLSNSVNHAYSKNSSMETHTSSIPKLTPEQQRAELKKYLEHRKEEKQRVERVKRQRDILKPSKKQKRTTTRTFRVGKSKYYPRIGVLIPNKTIRTQVLTKKQLIRETPLEDIRRYLIKKGLIRVGSSCPNDVLRQMYESSMMMCGEIQNHNPDNLLYNYLHNGL